jgi:hypothetical protein
VALVDRAIVTEGQDECRTRNPEDEKRYLPKHQGIAMSDRTKPMDCALHGRGHATFVCQHLVRGSKLGFFCADDPGDERPDAWCGECDRVMQAEGGWNDRSEQFAKVTLLCSECYDVVRERNEVKKPR